MTVSREELMAFVDGELRRDEAERMETLVAQDAGLRREVERQKALAAGMRAAIDSRIGAEVPGRFVAAVHGSPVSWRFRLGALWRDIYRSIRIPNVSFGRLWPVLAAAACGLIVGLAVERSILESAPIAAGDNGLLAHGSLAKALQRQLASEQRGTEGVIIGISFRAASGVYCRSFSASANAGLACHYGDGWRIAALASQVTRPHGEYEQAGSAMPASIRAAVRSMIAGAPLDARAERRARAAGWQ